MNKAEPRPPRGVPPMPKHLPETARQLWRWLAPRLDDSQVLTKVDGPALELLCDAYAEYRAARAVIEAQGATYGLDTEVGGTMVRTRPEVGIAADAWRRMRAMLTEFGLTPASRSKVSMVGAVPEDPFEEYLRRGRA